jgi:hypothetical protein
VSAARKARVPWVDHGNGIRTRACRPTPQATIERAIQRDTLGLGHGRQPDDWQKVGYSHTVTVATKPGDDYEGRPHFNSGVTLALAQMPPGQPLARGEAYIWYREVRDGNGGNGVYPTAPLWGRFMSQTRRGPKVLSGRGRSRVLGAEYAYCFRVVGTAGFDADLFPRSEIPVPVPGVADRQKQPAEFDVLQHAAKALDRTLCNMADVVDMTDELENAAKGGADDCTMRAHRQARAYRVLATITNEGVRQSGAVERQLADFLAASPKLARWLARLQAEA